MIGVGRATSQAFGGRIPPHNFFSKIATLGIRFDLNQYAMLRAEYQQHVGTFVLSGRENPDPLQTAEDWDAFALQIAVRF